MSQLKLQGEEPIVAFSFAVNHDAPTDYELAFLSHPLVVNYGLKILFDQSVHSIHEGSLLVFCLAY